jgi:DNA polymerase/3'-5' exonuclease PolX
MRKNKSIEIPVTENPSNLKLFLEFNKLIKIYQYIYDHIDNEKEKTIYKHKIISLKNSAKQIRIFKDHITDVKQITDLPGVGNKTVLRVQEFIDKGKLSDVDAYCAKNDCEKIFDPTSSNKLYDELITIFGIGDKLAHQLMDKDKITSIKNLKDRVKSNTINIPEKVKIGLKYYGKIKNKIPRDEITKIREFIYTIFEKFDSSIVFDICGSYRREKDFSNDIDLLITTTNPKPNFLKSIVEELYKNNLLIESFTGFEENSHTGFMGLCKYLNNPIRKIDIRFVEPQSFFTALLYFTGSYEFNERMRSIAKRDGYKLNEYGLYNLKLNKSLPIYSEKDVFNILNMKYLEPKDRI